MCANIEPHAELIQLVLTTAMLAWFEILLWSMKLRPTLRAKGKSDGGRCLHYYFH